MPERWKQLEFSVLYRGRVILIQMERMKTLFRVTEGEPLNVQIYDRKYCLDAAALTVPCAG